MSTAVITASSVSALFMRAASEASKISDNLFYSEGYFDGYNKQRVYPRKRTVCALGLFDGVHRGHQLIITTAVKKAQSLDGHSAVFCFKTDTVTSKGHDGRIEMLMSDEEKHKKWQSLGSKCFSHLICRVQRHGA